MDPLFDAKALTELLNRCVTDWHNQPIIREHDHPFLSLAVQLQAHNFELWHEEDKARDTRAQDNEIATIKRAIDGLNQRRNNAMESVDEFVLRALSGGGIQTTPETPLHSESVGAIVDRLSILALKVFHMLEQAERTDVDDNHREICEAKHSVLVDQQRDLTECLAILHDDLLAGRRRFKVYRQMKMYNDPKLNPVLYEQK